MGSSTVELLYGTGHDFHGGNIGIHRLMLWGNSISRWHSRRLGNVHAKDPVIWIPLLKRAVDVAMLMIGLFVARNERLLACARKVIPRHVSLRELDLYRDTTESVRKSLYTTCRRIQFSRCLVVSLEGSHLLLRGQLESLRKYRINGEICKAIPGEALKIDKVVSDPGSEAQLVEGPQPAPSRASFHVLAGTEPRPPRVT